MGPCACVHWASVRTLIAAVRTLFREPQAQQMCDMPLPRGHENDGAPLLPKYMVQDAVDARALHLCQQWNFVVAQMQSQVL